MDEIIVKRLEPLYLMLAAYHQYEVLNIENIPKQGRGLIVLNHSLASYDIFLLCASIYLNRKRVVRTLIEKLFYKIPYLGGFMEKLGSKQATPHNARALLEAEELVGVAPGGMEEALRPSTLRYQTIWQNRTGFVRLSIETQTPIILAACPRADDIYHAYENPITAIAYKKLHLPVPIARGIGLTPLPRPVKLKHLIGEPIIPPAKPRQIAQIKPTVREFHHFIQGRMRELMQQAILEQNAND